MEVEENQPNMKTCPTVYSVEVLREGGGGGTAGEERMNVSINIQCNNKKKPFVRKGTTAHPHPHVLAFLSLPFVSLHPGVILMCLCLVGAGGNGWEALNMKNMPTTAGFSTS